MSDSEIAIIQQDINITVPINGTSEVIAPISEDPNITVTINEDPAVIVTINDDQAITVPIQNDQDITTTIQNDQDITVPIYDIVTNFIELEDVPGTYVGQAGKLVKVNSTETGLEFIDYNPIVDWGEINGTLSDQIDLQAALNLKANLNGATFTGPIYATNLSGTNTGDEQLATNSGLILSNHILNIGTPSTISDVSTNSVTGSTHTHAISGIETISNKSSFIFLGTSDILYPTQNAVKSYVDNQISSENYWDRDGTTLKPHNTNDNIDVGTGDIKANSFTIGSNTLNSSEFKYLDGQNQYVLTSSSPSFVGLTVGNNNAVLKRVSGVLTDAVEDSDYQKVITWGDGLSYLGGNANIDYNTTNLKITDNKINTIQDVSTTSSPSFSGLKVGTSNAILKRVDGLLSDATADSDYQKVITWRDGLTYSNGIADVDYNTNNLRITSDKLNTIQDISSSDSPTFTSVYTNKLIPRYDSAKALAITKADGTTDLMTFNTTSTTSITNVYSTLSVYGNIYQSGSSYETHAEQVYTKDNLIITRDGATVGLGVGEYSGIQAHKYDGTNEGQLVFDKDGWARVGDIGNLQKLATIVETPNDTGVPFYKSSAFQLQTDSDFLYDSTNNILTIPKLKTGVIYPASDSTTALSINKANGTTNILTIDSTNSRIGIGTTSPQYKLDVAGNVKTTGQLISSVATGTAPLSVSSTTLVPNLNADLLDGHDTSYFQTALTNPVTGTGTSGYLLKFIGTSTIGNSPIYTDGTNIGIGTTSPGAKLDVNGNIKLQSGTAINEFSTDTTLSGNSDLAVPTEKATKTYVNSVITGLDSDDIPEGNNLYFTNERAQDAIGTILTDSSTIDFTYDDATPKITADIKPAGISHKDISDIGTKTHAQLDAHFTDANAHTWANINKTVSNIADITTRSHTSLTDIGTNTHTQIDNHISDSSDPHGSTLTQTTLNCTNLQIGGVAVTSSANELNYVDGVTSNIQTQINQANPVGRIVMYGGSSAPTGWFLCNGAAVSRTTYSALFAVIGTTFGAGDGSTTFNLPDMRGIFPRGAGTSGKLSNANGTAFSGTLGTYQNDKFQGHYHTTYFSSDSGSNSYPVGGTTRGSLNIVTDTPAARGIVADGTNGNPRIGAETNPANLGLNFIIKY